MFYLYLHGGAQTIDNGNNPPYSPARQHPVPASFPQQTGLRHSARMNIRNPGNQD